MAAGAEAAFAPEPMFAEDLQGVAVALQIGLKDVTGHGTGKTDNGHTELPTSAPCRRLLSEAPAF